MTFDEKNHSKNLTLPKTSLFTAFYSQKLCFANSIPSSLPSNFLKIFENFLEIFWKFSKRFRDKTSEPSISECPNHPHVEIKIFSQWFYRALLLRSIIPSPGTRNTLRRWPLLRWAQPHNTLFKTFIAIRQQCLTCRHNVYIIGSSSTFRLKQLNKSKGLAVLLFHFTYVVMLSYNKRK